MTLARLVLAVATALSCASSLARAGGLTKEECLDAHSRGQDAKDLSKLSLARKLFLTCAQAGCPPLVQSDCARFADEMSRLQPTVTFVARDGNGVDLPDTTVYVDGALVSSRLDGAAHDLDPGSHSIRFQSGGREQIVSVVIGSGEKGRTVVATFKASSGPPATTTANADLTAPATSAVADKPARKTTHPTGAKVLIVSGIVLAAGGGGLSAIGLLKLPSNCQLSSHTCAAAPGDPSLSTASSAIKLTDIGMAIGAAGAIAIVGGTYWFVTHGKPEKEHLSLAPWLLPGGGGLAVSGPL